MSRFALICVCLLWMGCMTVRPYPDGTCREYKPLCLSGHERCETDKYGCEACTCVSSEVGSRAPGPWTPR